MSETTKKLNRIPSIDRFRGAVIFSMIIFQFAEHFKNLGKLASLAHHAPKEDAFYILPNFSIADIIAPMFILAIGLTYIPSLKRRIERDGKKKACIHFVGRYLTLIGIGMTMDGVNDLLDGKNKPVETVCKILSLVVVVLVLLYGFLRLIKQKKAAHFIGTALGLLVVLYGVFGVILAAVNSILLISGKTDESFNHWVVLHHIGFAGLVALPFAMFSGKNATLIRFIGGTGILALFTAFHESTFAWTAFPNNMELVDKVADGGFVGGFAWGAMLILYLAFSDLYYKNRKLFAGGLGIFALITAAVIIGVFCTLHEGTQSWAGALSSFLPINKGSVSPSYVIIATFISLLAFFIFDLFNGFMPKFDPLRWWGKNPILMYCIEFAVIGGLNAALGDFFKTASVPVASCIIVAVIVGLTYLVYILDKKNIIVKL